MRPFPGIHVRIHDAGITRIIGCSQHSLIPFAASVLGNAFGIAFRNILYAPLTSA